MRLLAELVDDIASMMAAESSANSLDSTTNIKARLTPTPTSNIPLETLLANTVTSAHNDVSDALSNQSSLGKWDQSFSGLLPGFNDASFLSQIGTSGGGFGDAGSAFLPQLMSPLLPSASSVLGVASNQPQIISPIHNNQQHQQHINLTDMTSSSLQSQHQTVGSAVTSFSTTDSGLFVGAQTPNQKSSDALNTSGGSGTDLVSTVSELDLSKQRVTSSDLDKVSAATDVSSTTDIQFPANGAEGAGSSASQPEPVPTATMSQTSTSVLASSMMQSHAVDVAASLTSVAAGGQYAPAQMQMTSGVTQQQQQVLLQQQQALQGGMMMLPQQQLSTDALQQFASQHLPNISLSSIGSTVDSMQQQPHLVTMATGSDHKPQLVSGSMVSAGVQQQQHHQQQQQQFNMQALSGGTGAQQGMLMQQFAPAAPSLGTLVLHNNQLILLPNSGGVSAPLSVAGASGILQNGQPVANLQQQQQQVGKMAAAGPRMVSVNPATGQIMQAPAGVMQGGLISPAGNTYTINTPQGLVQMNTTPHTPNQLPTALMLPSGQIVPVVSQPGGGVQAAGGNIMMANHLPLQQQGVQTPVLAPSNGGLHIFSGNSLAQNKPPTISAMVSGSGMKSSVGQTNTVHYLPVAPSNAVVNAQTRQPVIISSIAPKPSTVRQQLQMAGTNATSGKGGLQLGAQGLTQIRGLNLREGDL